MSHKTLVRLGYKDVVVDTADLTKLLEILEGAEKIEYGSWIDGKQVHYAEEEPFHVEYRPLPVDGYITAEEHKQMREEYLAREAQEAEENDLDEDS